MSHTPSGPLTLPLANLRALIAASASWQTWRVAANAAAALEGVHLVSLPPPEDGAGYTLEELQNYRPFCLVGMPQEEEVHIAQRIAETAYEESGTLALLIEADVPAELRRDPAAAETWFLNQVGAVLSDCYEKSGTLSGSTAYLTVHAFRCAAPQRASEDVLDTEGDYVSMLIRVDWGT